MPLLGKKPAPKKTPAKISVGIFSVDGLFPLYLAVISLLSVVVMCVNIGLVISSLGNYLLITDKEYILSDKTWEIRQCSEMSWKGEESVEKTPEEIEKCEIKAEETAIAQRSIRIKETFIDSLSWSFVFGLLFAFHYPKFLASRRK